MKMNRQKFCKPWPLPYALKEKVEIEFQRLVDTGIITSFEHCAGGKRRWGCAHL